MTIREFFEDYYDGYGPVVVFGGTHGVFTITEAAANSHTCLPSLLTSHLGGQLNEFKVIFYLRHVDLEPDDGSEEKITWNIGVRRLEKDA